MPPVVKAVAGIITTVVGVVTFNPGIIALGTSVTSNALLGGGRNKQTAPSQANVNRLNLSIVPRSIEGRHR